MGRFKHNAAEFHDDHLNTCRQDDDHPKNRAFVNIGQNVDLFYRLDMDVNERRCIPFSIFLLLNSLKI